MKKATLLIALLFVLIACRSRLTPAPVEVSATPSKTPSPTVTPNVIERYQGTLQANQTQNAGVVLTQSVRLTEGAQTRAVEALTPTLTPTIVPSPTMTPSPTLFELLAPPELGAKDYRLTLPAPDTLIHLDLLNSLPEYDEALWNQSELRIVSF